MIGRLKSITAGRRLLSLVDQATQAAGNLVVTVLMARWLPVDGYALVATSLTIWFFFEAVQRTGILMPYITSVPRPKDNRDLHSTWFALNCIIFILAGVVLYIVSLNASGLTGNSALLGAFLVPSAGLFSYGKRTLYHLELYRSALLVSLTNVFTLFIGLVLLRTHSLPMNGAVATTIYATSFFIGGLLALSLLRSTLILPLSLAGHIRSQFSMISHMSLGAIAAYFYNNGVQFVLAALAAASEAAAFTATRVLVRPLNVVSVAIGDIERSTAARILHDQGEAALGSFLKRLMMTLLIILAPLGLLLLIYAPDIISILFNGKYDEFSIVARTWIVVLIPQILALPLDIKQSLQGQAKALLYARAMGAAACIATLLVCLFLEGTLTATEGVASVGVGRSVSLIGMILFQRVYRSTNSIN